MASYAACCWLLPAVMVAAPPFARWWVSAFAASLQYASTQREPWIAIATIGHGFAPWPPLAAAWLVAAGGAVASSAACGAMGWSSGALRWRWSKASPVANLRSLFSRDACMQTAVALFAVSGVLVAASVACGAVLWNAAAPSWQAWFAVTRSALVAFWWRATIVLTLVATAEVWMARARHASRLRMSMREIRDERAEQEGKPEVKARRRSVAIRRSRR